MLYVDLNLDGIKPLFAQLSKGEISKIMKRSIKLAARKANTKSIDLASKEYNLKKKDLRKRIFTRFNLGTQENPQAKIEFQFKPIGLEKFKPKQIKSGVTVQVLRKDGRVHLRHAFIATGKNKTKGKLVFVRKNAIDSSTSEYVRKLPSGGMRRSNRGAALPIARLQTKGLSEVMQPHANVIVEVAGTEGQKEMERQLNLVLGR